MEPRVILMAAIGAAIFSCLILSWWQARLEARRQVDLPPDGSGRLPADTSGGQPRPGHPATTRPVAAVPARRQAVAPPEGDRTERDDAFDGHSSHEHGPGLDAALHTFRQQFAWNRHELAHWLGLSLADLDALAREPVPEAPEHHAACDSLTERFSVHRHRIDAVLRHARSGPAPRSDS